MDIKETAAGKVFLRRRESYSTAWKKYADRAMEGLRKEILRQHRIDIFSESFKEKVSIDLSDPGFSIKRLAESVRDGCDRIREANDATVLQQLLRSGIQTRVNNEYQAVATNFEEWVSGVTSNKLIELYAPLYRAGYIAPVEDLEEPPQLSISGADLQIRNREKAAILTISRNMIDFDQSAQVEQQAAQVGENAKNIKDSYCYQRWLSPSAGGTDAGGYYVPPSQTGSQAGETTWPWNTSFTKGGGANRPASYLACSYQAFIQGRVLARKMKDPKGARMLVMPDTILAGVGVADPIHEMVDPDSQFWPSTGTIKQSGTLTGGGAASADTGAGTQHAKNLLKGKYNVCDTIWLPDTAYGLTQAGKGFTLQQARPLSVVQENHVSGASFSVRAFRYRIDEMYEADHREPRFSILLSDGSI